MSDGTEPRPPMSLSEESEAFIAVRARHGAYCVKRLAWDGPCSCGIPERLAEIEAAAEQRGRDQWLRATAHGARQWEGLLARFDLAEDADASAVIAAARADPAA